MHAGARGRGRFATCIASKDGDEDVDEAEEKTAEISDDGALPTSTFGGSAPEAKKEPSIVSQISLAAFKLFSYCIQFLGAFFFLGFILNLLGYGYTVDLERGLVVDKIQTIRNEVQFEREIEREEREDMMMGGGGSGGSRYIIAPNVPENNVVSAGDPKVVN